MTKGWSEYSWPPAIVLVSVMLVFLMDFGAERYVDYKYGFAHSLTDHHQNVEALVTDRLANDSEGSCFSVSSLPFVDRLGISEEEVLPLFASLKATRLLLVISSRHANSEILNSG